VPLLLVAGAVEGFVSPSDLPVLVKALLGLSLAIALLAYIASGRQPASPPGPTSGGGTNP
jgi:hypothetical protein